MRSQADRVEAVCLSTCNRTELYLADESGDAAEREGGGCARSPRAELGPALYRLRDEAAALHLFRVAAGLDSLVPGEGEILGQVRAAYEAGATGPLLDRLFRQALHAGQEGADADRDRREPRVGLFGGGGARAAGVRRSRRAAVCSSSARARSASRPPGTSRRAARRSRPSPTAPAERAEDLTERFGGEAATARPCRGRARQRGRRRLLDERAGLDSRRATGRACAARRKGRPLFLIDLAVPRDLDPAIHELEGCYLYDIDDLQAVVARDARRPPARGRARRGDRRGGGGAVPRVAGVARRRSGDRVPARARGGDSRRRASPAKLERSRSVRAVESVTAQIVNKLLHLPTVRMKQAAAAADGVVYADAVRHLFGLEDER